MDFCEQHIYSISKILEPALVKVLAKSCWEVEQRLLTIVLNNLGAVDIRINDAILSGTMKAYIWTQQAPFPVQLECIVYEFLSNHTTQATPNDMQLTLGRPSNMIDEVKSVLCHLRSRVPNQRLVRLSHASVVKDQTRILVALISVRILTMAEIFGLPLP